jgi:hypothetical protein
MRLSLLQRFTQEDSNKHYFIFFYAPMSCYNFLEDLYYFLKFILEK